MAISVEQIYNQYVQPLSPDDRLRLIALAAGGLVASGNRKPSGQLNLLDLEGLGAEIWNGVDAQEYVNGLRDEWDASA